MALGSGIARCGVIGHQVAMERVVGELNLHIATQSVNFASLLALARVDDDGAFFTDRHTNFLIILGCSRRRSLNLVRSAGLCRLMYRRRRCDHQMAISDGSPGGCSSRGAMR